jgi:hypothetical protein
VQGSLLPAIAPYFADFAALFRFAAALFACFDSAECDAADRPSRLSALVVARERFADGFDVFLVAPFFVSRAACLRVLSLACPAFGGFNFTPARRALESPMAIACFVERAQCLP